MRTLRHAWVRDRARALAVRYAVLVVPPMLIIFFRCAGGALILYAWLAWRRELERTTWAQWRTAAVAGLLLFLGCHVALAWAEQRMSSGQAALFSSAIPLWIVLIESVKVRTIPQRPRARHARRILLGGRRALGVRGQRAARRSRALLRRATGPPRGLALLFLVVCGTVIGFGAYTWLLRVASPAAVSSYAFVNPMVALALGVAVGDDALSSRIVLSAVLVIAAVALTRGNTPPSRVSRVGVPEAGLRIAS